MEYDGIYIPSLKTITHEIYPSISTCLSEDRLNSGEILIAGLSPGFTCACRKYT